MLSSICRVCLREKETAGENFQLTSLFRRCGGVSLDEKIMCCTSVHVKFDDRLPPYICINCVDRLNDSYDFKILCEFSDATLRKKLADDAGSDSGDQIFVKVEDKNDVNINYFSIKCEMNYNYTNGNDIKDIKCGKKRKSTVRKKPDNNKNNKTSTEFEDRNNIGIDCFPQKYEENRDNIKRTQRRKSNKNHDNGCEKPENFLSASDDDSVSDNCPLSFYSREIDEIVLDKKTNSTDDNGQISETNLTHNRNGSKTKKEQTGKKMRMITKKGKKSKKNSEVQKNDHQCSICGKTVSSRFRLRMHLRIHTGEKPFECDYCAKSFSLSQNLKVHERIHTGEKPLSCNVCGKNFAQSAGLIAHMRLHTGEKPYKCNLCLASFRTFGHLQYHTKLHTGEKNFECTTCNRAFITKGDLTQHLKIHTGERPYICSVCGARMTRKSHLTRHMRTHTGEKPFKCNICGSGYSDKCDMVKHRNKHPPISNTGTGDIVLENYDKNNISHEITTDPSNA